MKWTFHKSLLPKRLTNNMVSDHFAVKSDLTLTSKKHVTDNETNEAASAHK